MTTSIPPQFSFRHSDAWHYPDGLAGELTTQLLQQGVCIVAADCGTAYIEHAGVTWTLNDNGGELSLSRVNSDALPTTIPTSGSALPSDVFACAIMLVIRIMAILAAPLPHTPDELASIDEEQALVEELAGAAWDKLLETPGCDMRDITSFVEVREFADLTSERISPAVSIQFDSQNHTALIAGNTGQVLLNQEEEEKLYHLLADRYEARYGAMHRAFYRNYK